MALLLCVVISPKEARQLKLSEVPESVDQLVDVIKERLELQGDFLVQFEDPDFGNALCNLTTMSELPAEHAVLHIVWDSDSSSLNQCIGSVSSLDTASVHSGDIRSSWTDSIQTNLRHVTQWPSPFPIPKLSYDVELQLRKGNETYEKSKKGLDATREIKMEILDKIAQAIFEIKSYPEKDELESVGSSLVLKYPCLKEPGSITGYEGWKTSIKYKLGNFRTKLRRAGCNEVDVNSKRKGGTEDNSPFTLKRPRRGEVNHVRDYPQHHSDFTLEEERLHLVEEMKKKKRDQTLIQHKMELTFSLRRKEIVEGQPMVSEVQERWPALFSCEQISQEFCRITSKDLLESFRGSPDIYVPRLLRLYWARKGAFGQKMEDVLDALDEKTSDILTHRKIAALRGLPIFVRDDTFKFFLQCSASDTEEQVIRDATVAILSVHEDDDALNAVNVAVVLEGAIMLQDLPDLCTAFAYLFGLLYTMNIDSPKEMFYTFEAVQCIFFDLGSRCSQRIRSLRTKLQL
ncbi:sterile alpha motif domain-containing protein 3-like isoform 4-T5 [Pholidichthys leucotaenia]